MASDQIVQPTPDITEPDIADKAEPAAPAAPASRRRVSAGNLAQGAEVIRGYLRTLPNSPGVYRMMNEAGDVLYVGKAKNLKKRVVNYTHVMKLPNRLQRMVAETTTMEFVTTHTEVERCCWSRT